MRMRTEIVAVVALALALALAVLMAGRLEAQVVAPVIATPTPTIAPTPSPVPTPQVFSCNCSTPGRPVVWSGRLSAANFFQASQAAMGQCEAALGSKPTSPLIPPPSGLGVPTPLPPMFNPCSSCACN